MTSSNSYLLSRRHSSLLLLILVGLVGSTAYAQNQPVTSGPPPPVAPASVSRDSTGRATLRAHRVVEAMRTDGALDEPIYQRIQPIGGFIQSDPANGQPATEQTEVWILFDDDNLYVSGKAYDRSPEKWVLNEMRRDIPNVSANESVGFSIDTFNDKRNGFLFEVNALGGFLDAQITNEGFPPNQNWNAVFAAEVGRFDGGWTFEYRIPFWSIRYQPGSDQVWGFNMRRVVRWKNEESHIVPVPSSIGQRRGLIQVSLSAPLVGIDAPPRGKGVELRPFGITSVTTDNLVRPPLSNDLTGNVGLDAKVGVKNLTADLTWRTDFAQVEVDEQQVNLTRFNLLYPEKRTFFLEGQGIFAFGIGAGPNTNGGDVPTMFFSRQIGLSQGQVVPIIGGGRLTGKLGPYSIGVINMQTDDKPSARAVTTNFSVMRLRRDILRRSAVGVIYVDRSRSLSGGGRAKTYGGDAGFSFFNDVNINAFVAQTETPGVTKPDLSYRGQFNYAGDRYGLVAERLVIEEGFIPEVGFVRRPNMRKWTGTARFSPRPAGRNRLVRKTLFEVTGSYIENNASVLESRQWDQTFGLDFRNGDTLRVQATESFEFLARPFRIDPSATIPPGAYDFNNLAVRYTLGAQRRFAATTSLERGSFYGGDKTTVGLSGGRFNLSNQVQVQPGVSINHVELPYGRFTATQLQTRLVYTLTPRTFVAALMQYNSSSHLLSTNLRLRWEYVPGSELFVVYTDERNSATSGLPDLSNRAFVVKWAPLVRF